MAILTSVAGLSQTVAATPPPAAASQGKDHEKTYKWGVRWSRPSLSAGILINVSGINDQNQTFSTSDLGIGSPQYTYKLDNGGWGGASSLLWRFGGLAQQPAKKGTPEADRWKTAGTAVLFGVTVAGSKLNGTKSNVPGVASSSFDQLNWGGGPTVALHRTAGYEYLAGISVGASVLFGQAIFEAGSNAETQDSGIIVTGQPQDTLIGHPVVNKFEGKTSFQKELQLFIRAYPHESFYIGFIFNKHWTNSFRDVWGMEQRLVDRGIPADQIPEDMRDRPIWTNPPNFMNVLFAAGFEVGGK